MSDDLELLELDDRFSGSESRAEGDAGTLFDQVIEVAREQSSAWRDLSHSKNRKFSGKLEASNGMNCGSALDVGCGLGQFSSSLVPRSSRVTAVDVSKQCCERTESKLVASVVPYKVLNSNIDKDWQDVWELGERFDTVLLSRVIDDLDDPRVVIRRLWQKMSKDSMMVVVGLDRESGTDNSLDVHWDKFSDHRPAGYKISQAVEDLCEYLDEVGIVHSLQRVVRSYLFTDPVELAEYLSLSEYAASEKRAKADSSLDSWSYSCFEHCGSTVLVDAVFPVLTIWCRK